MRKASELWAEERSERSVDGTPFRFHVEQNRVVPDRFVPTVKASMSSRDWLVLGHATGTVELSFGEVISNNAVMVQEHTEVQLGWTRRQLTIWFGSFNRLAKKCDLCDLGVAGPSERSNTEEHRDLLVDIAKVSSR